jgi:hypothetical protein
MTSHNRRCHPFQQDEQMVFAGHHQAVGFFVGKGRFSWPRPLCDPSRFFAAGHHERRLALLRLALLCLARLCLALLGLALLRLALLRLALLWLARLGLALLGVVPRHGPRLVSRFCELLPPTWFLA